MSELTGITKALVEAQKKILSASKDATNPHFGSNYTSLKSVQDACKDALLSNDIAVTQIIETLDEHVYLKTTLHHISGERLESHCPLFFDRSKMQSLGSAITYARRYSLAAFVGVVQEDDDAAAAASKVPAKKNLEGGGREHLKNAKPLITPVPAPKTIPASAPAAVEARVKNVKPQAPVPTAKTSPASALAARAKAAGWDEKLFKKFLADFEYTGLIKDIPAEAVALLEKRLDEALKISL